MKQPRPSAKFDDEVTDNDRLWAFLAYVLTPILPLLIFFLEEKRKRPFLQAHSPQALVVGLLNLIIGTIISRTLGSFFLNLPFLIWLLCVYWGYRAYQGKYFEIPLISKFVKKS
jgi:uncharacterized membrane protein